MKLWSRRAPVECPHLYEGLYTGAVWLVAQDGKSAVCVAASERAHACYKSAKLGDLVADWHVTATNYKPYFGVITLTQEVA